MLEMFKFKIKKKKYFFLQKLKSVLYCTLLSININALHTNCAIYEPEILKMIFYNHLNVFYMSFDSSHRAEKENFSH